jgi:soluble lytic murein transglycosylase-like protein
MRGVTGLKIIAILIITLIALILTFIVVTKGFASIPQGQPGTGPITQYDSIIQQASFKYSVDIALIKAVIRQESNFNPAAVSSAGAKGLMQLMPGTASDLGDPKTDAGKYCNLKITDLFDPEQNINGGTCYLSYLLKRYNNNKELALAAYNAGPGRVDACNCVPNIEETQTYVRLVAKYYDDYRGQTGWTAAA